MPDTPAEAPARDMVGKALSLLTLLGDHPHGIAASALARQSGFPLSTAHRLLGTLVREGYAKFEQSSRLYTVGLRIFQLAQTVSVAYGFSGMTRPILEGVSALSHEATLLAVLDGNQQLYVHTVQGPQQVRVVGEPGTHGPLHCAAVGKVLIAFSPDAVRARLTETLALDSFTANTITDRAAFRAEIDAVRAQGYAVADEEHEAGIRAISVPVFVNQQVVAAVAIAAPAFRTSIINLENQLPQLEEAARSLSTVMALR
ncbi:IclR family transcriptional regulator [Cryobacterium frigoriphilum]|uniref:IclR family transcriptional regulator n=1 Tax=Cryobacterium frigoriphilum TaxID=1259150 RepID=A0A4R8ZUV2_9MICO|nr:IclR family transcriptional regulator [Cryobacterium frigoriphilum]TFD46910.1 IclR family transcriptional regulator [Cryobacterium frigoriphilum]